MQIEIRSGSRASQVRDFKRQMERISGDYGRGVAFSLNGVATQAQSKHPARAADIMTASARG